MPSGVRAQRNHFELADDGAAHRCFGNAVMRQHVGLAFGGGGAVAAHRGKDERLHALLFPELPRRYATMVAMLANAAAADADGDV